MLYSILIQRCNRRIAQLNIHIVLHEYLNHSSSIQRLRFNVLYLVNGCSKRALRYANDAVGHVLRNHAVKIPDNADDRNVDVGENIRGSTHDCEPTHDQDEYGHDYKRVGPP